MDTWGKLKSLLGRTDKGGSEAAMPRPKDILPDVGRDLVTGFKVDPDRVWKLKSVTKPLVAEKKLHLFRVFSPSQVAKHGLKVVNYDSLNDHPELVLYSGKVNLRNHGVEFDSPAPKTTRPAGPGQEKTESGAGRKAA